MKVHVQVEGLGRFERLMLANAAKLPVYVDRTNKQVARLVKVRIQKKMYMEMVEPRSNRTGRLERSVTIKDDPEYDLAQELSIGDLMQGVEYAGWWEFGGDNQSPTGQRYRDWYPQGRTVFPSVYELKPKIDAMYLAVAVKLAKSKTYGGA